MCIDIVHGDISPENMLVFKDEQGKPTIKIADFGYATNPGDDIYLPLKWPWTAPERHIRVYQLNPAKKADIYSFGMVCLWVLFSNSPSQTEFMMVNKAAMPPDETSNFTTVNLMKQTDQLLDYARERIDLETSLSDAQRIGLKDFFSSTIRLDPNNRQLDLQELSKHLGGE